MIPSDRRSTGVRIASLGAVAQLAGFGLDAWLHGRDPGLAARENVFSLGNPAHALVAVGLVLVVVGIAVAWAGPRTAPVVAALCLAGVLMTAPAGSHPHADPDLEEARARAADIIPGLEHTHAKPAKPQPLDAGTRQALAAQLTEARATALRYPTVADAEAAGYRMVAPYVPLIGGHYLRDDLLDAAFAVDRPAMLLYDGTGGDSAVVGLSYYVTSPTEPAGFAGPADRWHRHVGLCLDDRSVVIGGEALSEAKCEAMGGRKEDGSDGWMVHAWVVPGWESPDGVFSAENRNLL